MAAEHRGREPDRSGPCQQEGEAMRCVLMAENFLHFAGSNEVQDRLSIDSSRQPLHRLTPSSAERATMCEDIGEAVGAASSHLRLEAFLALFFAGFALDQTPSVAPVGSTKTPIIPFFPMSVTGTTTVAPPFSAFARIFFTLSTST